MTVVVMVVMMMGKEEKDEVTCNQRKYNDENNWMDNSQKKALSLSLSLSLVNNCHHSFNFM